MRDYIEQIASSLNKGEKVIFYTVGSATFCNVRELKKRFGLLPTAICDRDKKKQGQTYRGLEGINIISPEQALLQYPQGKFFITSLDYKYQIIGYLTKECGVNQDRIINYVPVEKIKSCSFLQKALIYDRNGNMQFCWREPCPSVPSENKILNPKELLELRNRLIDEIKNGKTLSHSACANCPQICEGYYPKTPSSWSVNYFCQSVCNYKCSYCTLAHSDMSKLEKDVGRHTLGEVVNACKEESLLNDEHSVILSTAGEPLLHPKRKEFYEAFDGAELHINTNCSIYDEDLADLMNKEKVLLISSIDAGTSETYKQVKGVDCYEKVKKNLTEYAKADIGIVALKYIFVPGVNDGIKDIDGFIQLCEETNAMFVIVSVDYYSIDKITEQTKKMINYLNTKLYDKHILTVPYTAWETAEYTDKIKKIF